MKTMWSRMTMILALAAAAASAQSTNPQEVRVTIPFEFHFGKATLPAGEYMVRTPLPNVLSMVPMDGSAGAVMTAFAAHPEGDARAVVMFNRYGNHYFFSKVLSPRIQAEVAQSGQEREMASKRNRPQAMTVALHTR